MQEKSEKNLVLSFSLLMRLFEWCHEEAKDDVAMHKAMEKIVSFNDGVNPLTIDTYDVIIADAESKPESDDMNYSTEEDEKNAYDLGAEQADNGVELQSDGRNYSIVAGEMIKDESGRGASNDEIESFWNGYESKQPLHQGCFDEYDMSNIVQPMELTYTDDGEICDGCCSQEQECGMNDDLLSQIKDIIKIGQL